MPTTVATPRLVPYEPLADVCDEAFDEQGSVRPHYANLFDWLSSVDLERIANRTSAYLATECVAFRTKTGLRPFFVDPVPRLVRAAEWSAIEAGIEQRVRALNEFLLDAYGEQRIVAAGVVPARVIEGAEHFEPDLVGNPPTGGTFTHVSGMDLVRGDDGAMLVLEDNLRSPSGISFAQVARRAGDSVSDFAAGYPKLDIDGDLDRLGAMLRAAAPADIDEPTIALVSDGPASPAWYEHCAIADGLGINLTTLHQLEQRGGVVGARARNQFKPLDVIYRRTNLDRLRTRDGKLTRFGELLLEPLRRGTVASVNAFGTGVADDKLTHAYVEEIIRFYLDEEPLMRSVKTYDPGADRALAEIVAGIGDLVIKPRGGLGGAGVMIGPTAGRDELNIMRSRMVTNPRRWIAQQTVSLSTHPTLVRASLEPRRVDLRPYALMRADTGAVELLPGCLTRVALARGGMIVNSSSNGGGKDTWILPE